MAHRLELECLADCRGQLGRGNHARQPGARRAGGLTRACRQLSGTSPGGRGSCRDHIDSKRPPGSTARESLGRQPDQDACNQLILLADRRKGDMPAWQVPTRADSPTRDRRPRFIRTGIQTQVASRAGRPPRQATASPRQQRVGRPVTTPNDVPADARSQGEPRKRRLHRHDPTALRR